MMNERYTWSLTNPAWVDQVFDYYERRGVTVLSLVIERGYDLTILRFTVHPNQVDKARRISLLPGYQAWQDRTIPKRSGA